MTFITHGFRVSVVTDVHFLMYWMSVKLPDNFQMREHSWPCRFHIMRALASSLWFKMCTYDFLTNMAAHTDG
jgi:hypothetical protein